MRVLIADDSQLLRHLIGDAIVQAGCVVVGEAGDGVAAVASAFDLEPDVVIMDWQMPGLDGIAATAAIRAGRPGVAVIAFSTTDNHEVKQRFLAAGATACLAKTDIGGLRRELARRARSRS